MSLDDVQDISEAKMLIDMKNDQISSLKNSIKMIQIKTNKSIAEANYKINTEKNKWESLKKEVDRHKQQITKSKQQVEKLAQTNKQNEVKHNQAMKDLQEKLKNQRQISKGLANQVREYEISLQEVRQQIVSSRKEMKLYKKIVNIPKILQITSQAVAEDIPPYVDLMNILKDQSAQLENLQDQLSKVTQQTIGEISVRERKISRFEKQLRQLHDENSTLANQLTTVSEVIQEKEQEIMSQKQLLDKQKQSQQMTLQELNEQLHSLRSSMRYYENQSIHKGNKEEQALKFLHQMTEEFELKEKQYQKQILELTELYESYKAQHDLLEQQLQAESKQLKLCNVEHLEEISSLVQQIKSKEQMIVSIQNQTSVFQKHMQEMGLEIERWRVQAEETIKAKNEIKATLKNKEEKFHQKQSELISQIEELKRVTEELRQFRIEEEENRFRNLTSQLEPEVDWEGLCNEDLANHNAFLNKLYNLLSN